MMKKLLICALLIPLLALAADSSTTTTVNKPVVCESTKIVMDALINGGYKESPVWAGASDKSTFGLLINQQTGTWTLIEFDKETACVLGVGDHSRALSFGKKTTPV